MHREFLTPDYQAPVVLLSVLLALFVSYVTLDLAKRGRTSDITVARAWWIGGSLAMGTGLWSMHFVGMAAREWPIAVGYDYGLLLLSWVCAVVACAVPPGIASGEQLSTKSMVLGTATTAAALCAMHYSGIHAMVMRPGIVWDWSWVAASIVLAVLTCGGYLRLFFWMHQHRGSGRAGSQALAATVLGCALTGILYTSMQAAHIPATAVCLSAQAVQASSLGLIGGVGAFLLLLLALLCSLLDARLQTRASALKHSLQEANQELKNAALSDNITHLPNRLVFEDRLDRAIQQADEQHRKIAVLFIDLDGFKAVNESFGHGTGDALLVEAAKRLNQLSRHTDTLERVGADEFLMLLEGPMDTAAAAHVAQRVLASMGEAFHVANQDIALSCSVGIAFYPDHGPRSKLVANADAAMSAAKRAGGGLHCFFEPNMAHDSAQDEIELQRDLRHAIERNELMLYYQPKISAKTNQVTGAEALLRWKHPKRGMVSPAVFIPIAERFGLIGNLGHWVLEEACRQVRDWLDQGLRVRVAINLSVHQLRQVDFVHRIREVFARYHIDPSLITFEITESVAMEDTQATMHAFERLANAGVILSIDDFGTGYSSLSYLRKLCARQLKIDRSFVQDLSQSQDAKAIVEAVIRLAHALGLSVVAEGVETADQQMVLTDLDCDELQGFLFAKPMPAAQLTMWAMEDERPTASDAAGISFSNSIFAEGEAEAPSPEFAPTQPLAPNRRW